MATHDQREYHCLVPHRNKSRRFPDNLKETGYFLLVVSGLILVLNKYFEYHLPVYILLESELLRRLVIFKPYNDYVVYL